MPNDLDFFPETPKPDATPSAKPAKVDFFPQQGPKKPGVGERFVGALKDAASGAGEELQGVGKEWTKGAPMTPGSMVREGLGPLEGIGSGIVGMGKAGAAGLSGMATWLKGAVSGQVSTDEFMKGKDAAEGFLEKYMPSEPQSQNGKAVLKTLGLIPAAVHGAGEIAYETSNSPAMGAGVEALATLLTFGSPKSVLGKGKASAKHTPMGKAVTEAFDDLAANQPELARQVVDKVPSEKVKQDLTKRLDEILIDKPKDVKEIFKDAKSRGPGAVGVSEADVKDMFAKAKGPKEPPNPPAAGTQAQPLRLSPEQASSGIRNAVANGKRSTDLIEPNPRDFANLEEYKSALTDHRSALINAADLRPAIKTPYGKILAANKGEGHLHIMQRFEPGMTTEGLIDGFQDKRGNFYTRAEATQKFGVADAKDILAANAKPDPVIFMNMGVPVTKAQLTQAFTMGREYALKVPGYKLLEDEVRQSVEQAVRAVAPEALGPDARSAAAVLASNMAKQKHRESVQFQKSEPRRQFWNARGDEGRRFMLTAEKGGTFTDPMLTRAAQGYKNWADDIYKADQAKGIEYEPVDNYFYHLAKDPEKAEAFLHRKYGPQWGDPKFMKERSAQYIEDLEKAGFPLKTYNPEELMQLRQHASDIAHMKIDALRDMEAYGLAKRVRKGDVVPPDEYTWRSPNGEIFALGDEANAIFHNAFNTKSLWNAQGLGGAGFRAVMLAKNLIIPFKLTSLFHPVHVETMTAADALTSATKALSAGKMSKGQYAIEAVGQMFFKDVVKAPRLGGRSANIWRGKVPENKLTEFEKKTLQYQLEGGFIPDLSPEFKAHAMRRFQDAITQRRVAGAAFWMPFAALEKVYTRPVFEVWIPALKTYAFDTAARKALEANPALLESPLKRMEALRQIQKSVDNRFGEMTYSTTFMNKTVKDVGVGSLLSLGWQLGFLREYGGAAGEIMKGGKISKGQMDKALFVGFYTTQALLLGGLMTYALTGKPPTSLMDYVYPKNGDKNPDGTDARVSTPYYTREFASIGFHARNEGLMHGLGVASANKVSPAVGVIKAWASNLDYFGNEISDPNSPLLTQVGQKLKFTLGDMEPVATSSVRRAGPMTAKGVVLSVAGFAPAPKYTTETAAEGSIKSIYQKYYKSQATPYERVEYSSDARELRQARQSGDDTKYSKILESMQDKYKMSGKQVKSLEKGLGTDASIKMFQRFSATQQKQVLDKMTPEELEKFLPHAKKELRDYEPSRNR